MDFLQRISSRSSLTALWATQERGLFTALWNFGFWAWLLSCRFPLPYKLQHWVPPFPLFHDGILCLAPIDSPGWLCFGSCVGLWPLWLRACVSRSVGFPRCLGCFECVPRCLGVSLFKPLQGSPGFYRGSLLHLFGFRPCLCCFFRFGRFFSVGVLGLPASLDFPRRRVSAGRSIHMP